MTTTGSDLASDTNARPATRAEALVSAYERAGYRRLKPAILQPAEPFLDLAGEDIRRRLYLTTAPDGSELCLRPDLTIPVSREYLASAQAGRAAGFSYLGRVFRHRADAANEFQQAGIESFGRIDTAAADAEMVSLALDAVAHYGVAPVAIAMGDVALFAALIAALDLAPAWKRRLIKDFNRKANLAQDLDRLVLGGASEREEYKGVLAALEGASVEKARDVIADLLAQANISPVGGRTVDEIATRFLEQSALGASAKLPKEKRAQIEHFLSIAGDPDGAAAALRAFAKDTGIALNKELDLLESRTGFLAARGVDVKRIQFATAFSRGFDYYTGLVFELSDARQPEGPLVAGGRYDGLLQRLGSPSPIPAVGFAVWIERLEALGGSK